MHVRWCVNLLKQGFLWDHPAERRLEFLHINWGDLAPKGQLLSQPSPHLMYLLSSFFRWISRQGQKHGEFKYIVMIDPPGHGSLMWRPFRFKKSFPWTAFLYTRKPTLLHLGNNNKRKYTHSSDIFIFFYLVCCYTRPHWALHCITVHVKNKIVIWRERDLFLQKYGMHSFH